LQVRVALLGAKLPIASQKRIKSVRKGRKMGQEIGFVGLGAMGSPMVQRLLQAGHDVIVHDLNQAAMDAAMEAGAKAASSPAEIAARAEIVMVSLPTPDVVRKVALGEGGLNAGGRVKIYVDLSTTGARTAQEVAKGLEPHGITALDAPVSGGVAGAEAGSLAVMVSGDPAAFEIVRPALLEIGKNTRYVGAKVGQGQTLKLVNNLMAASNYAVAAECLVMGAKAGLDPDIMVDVISKSSGRSFVIDSFVSKAVLNRTFDFGFRMELMSKDVRLALEEAEAVGATMFTCSAAKQLYAHAMAQGAGPGDITALIKVLEQWAGTVVEGKGSQAA
jgi:3-hydroxyisobutyrate dehydrogenase-like beta-hydroxyacid dehydrogenase